VTLLEIRDADGVVVGRHRLANLPLTIGRGSDCDVILDDAQVSGSHARIERDADGAPMLVDAGSRNGVLALESGERVQSLALRPGLRARLGDTVLVFRGPDEVRPSTQAVSLAPKGAFELDAWKAFVLADAAVYAALAVTLLVNSTRPPTAGKILGPPFLLAALALFWGGVWSLVGRLIRRRFHFWGHATVGALGVLAIPVLGVGTEALGFALAAEDAFKVALVLLIAAVGAAMLHQHFRWITPWSPARRAVTALGVVAALGGVAGLIVTADHNRFSTGLPFSRTLEAPELRMRQGRTPAEFFDAARGLDKELQRELAKPR